mmetsp:Transcript_9844/g.36705  ORF Transcript_9844/g.36705 Transcript_9844/m.36705 type:complete len:359 (-) Transcript_9844:80-1156(-)
MYTLVISFAILVLMIQYASGQVPSYYEGNFLPKVINGADTRFRVRNAVPHNTVYGAAASLASFAGDDAIINAIASSPYYLPDYNYDFGLWAPSNAVVGVGNLYGWGGYLADSIYGGASPDWLAARRLYAPGAVVAASKFDLANAALAGALGSARYGYAGAGYYPGGFDGKGKGKGSNDSPYSGPQQGQAPSQGQFPPSQSQVPPQGQYPPPQSQVPPQGQMPEMPPAGGQIPSQTSQSPSFGEVPQNMPPMPSFDQAPAGGQAPKGESKTGDKGAEKMDMPGVPPMPKGNEGKSAEKGDMGAKDQKAPPASQPPMQQFPTQQQFPQFPSVQQQQEGPLSSYEQQQLQNAFSTEQPYGF